MKQITDSHYSQHTLAAPVDFVGRGLHSGKSVRMTLMPAVADSGYIFNRLDVAKNINQVPARWHNVTDTRLSTTVTNSAGVGVSTIEHLIAALAACGIGNCRIDIDGPEVPIMDGSSKVFVERINAVGLHSLDEPRRAIVITKPIAVAEGERSAGFVPFPEPWLDVSIDFEEEVIGKQRIALPVTKAVFSEHLSDARTFGFADQIETMKKLGLAQGGSLRNAVLVDKVDGVLNPEGLRYSNEFVRHKALDVLGDISLVGAAIMGCFVGKSSGHQLNNRLMRELMLQQPNWTFTTVQDAVENWEQLVTAADEAEPETLRASQTS